MSLNDQNVSRAVDPQQPCWQISQGHLNLLSGCPRKFQYVYLDQLGLPQLHPQDPQNRGAQFHQLMQQQMMGLEIVPMTQTDPQLQRWFDTFNQHPPPMIDGDRLSEHRRHFMHYGYLLVAVYDLLIQGEGQAQILDWKTYPRPHNLDQLRQDWQTRLYPYVLSETSSYAPEQISMMYWFAEAQDANASHFATFPYTREDHEQTQRDLAALLDQLNHWLAGYQRGENFPKVALEAGQCYTPKTVCRFSDRCQRQPRGEADLITPDALDEIDAIAEIPIEAALSELE